MDNVFEFFKQKPLPFQYISFPYLEDPAEPKHPTHLFYVNNVIAELSARFFNRAGFPHTEDKRKWNISWGQQFDPDEYKACASWQKINHFAGAFLIGRKSELHNRMTELEERTKERVDFYPMSFLVPQHITKLEKVWEEVPYWIVKPSASSRGDGIKILNSSETPFSSLISRKEEKEEEEKETYVCQQYINKPLLIKGRYKFDVRLYALVTSIAPLRIYLHDFGLTRIASHEYSTDIKDLCSQLTNISVNRDDTNFSAADQKLSLQQLYTILIQEGLIADHRQIVKEFDRIVATALVAGSSKIRQYHQSLVQKRNSSFELFGFDILIDENLHCWLMEVNVSPSMSGKDSELDRVQKNQIMAEMYNLARVVDCNPCDPLADKSAISSELYDSEWRNSVANIDRSRKTPWDWSQPNFADVAIVRDFVEEKMRLRKFRRIYPKRKTIDSFTANCAGKRGYLDMSFLEWMKMSNEARFEALKRGEEVYSRTLEQINAKTIL